MRKLLLCGLLLAPSMAQANTFDTFGFDARGISLGGAQTADSRDYTSVFYNPSRLALHNEINVGFGFTYEKPDMTLTPANPATPVAWDTPPDFSNFTLGFVYPFAGKLQDKLAIGVGLSLPVRNLLRVQSIDPGTPNWYLYQSSPDRIQIFIGAGFRPFEWLSIGAGIQTLADFGGDVQFNSDLFNRQFVRRDVTNELTTKFAPNVGLSVMPFQWLQFGFSWRSAMRLNFDLPNTVALGDIGQLYLDVHGVAFYTPHELTVGVHYEPIENLTITGDLEYALWSQAPNPAVTVTVRLTGDLVKGLGLEQVGAIDSHDPNPGFQDILIPRIGAEYKIGSRFAARAGYFFRPSFIPRQDGASNLLDGSTHTISAGLGVNFPDPLEILTEPVQVDIAAQHGFIQERTATKPTASGTPSYTYSGATSLFTAAIRYNF